MKFTETQLEEITRYQESRGVTRAAALKACKKAWAKGNTPAVRMIHMAAAAPALAPVDSMQESLADAVSTAEARQDAKPKAKAAKKAKAEKAASEPKPEKHYTVGSTDTVKRGFLLEMITWAGKQQSVSVASLYRKFGGRKVSELRCRRYVSYCVSHGILKLVKGGK